MRLVVLPMTLAALCVAASEPAVSIGSLKAVEGAINDKLLSNVSDPYDLLGPARGTYIEGHGAVFTFELNLVFGSNMVGSPFGASASEADVAAMHARKERRLTSLKETMRAMASNACKALPGLPSEENVVIEAFLFNYRWENTRGFPRRIVMTAQKGRLLEAANRHAAAADLAALFTEQEL